MRDFTRLIKCLSTRGLYLPEYETFTHNVYLQEDINGIATRNHSFIFTQLPDGTRGSTTTPVSEIIAKMPFSSMSIEGIHNTITPETLDHNNGHIVAMSARQTDPDKFVALTLVNYKHSIGDVVVRYEISDSSTNIMEIAISHLLEFFLDELPTYQIAQETVNARINLPKPGNPKKKQAIIKDHVFICAPTRNSYKTTNPITWTRNPFSHRWETRGHWRKIKGIGKNQFGEYGEIGRTWVSDCIKGPENAPLVKKTRIVLPGHLPTPHQQNTP